MSSLSLRLRILLTTSAIVIGTIALVIGLVGWITNAAIANAAEGASARTNSTLAEALLRTKKSLSTEAALLADRPGTRSLFQADFATVSDNLQDITAQLEIDWAGMTNAEGRIIGLSDESGLTESDSIPFASPLEEAINGRSWSGLERAESGPVMVTVYPVKIAGYVQSVLILAKRVDAKFLEKIERSAGVRMAVADGVRVVVSSLPGAEGLGSVESLSRREVRDHPYIAWQVDLKGSGLSDQYRFIALMPEENVTKPFAPLQSALLILLAAGLGISVVSGAYMAKSVTDPLDSVVLAAKTLESGQWPSPFDSSRSDEIGLLQRVFDEMTASLKASHEKLLSMLQVDPLTDLF